MNRFNAKTNVLFLAVILVIGTFAAITPSSSFIIGVEAQSETEHRYSNSYGPIPEYQDNNNYNKLKDSVSAERIKCNNININFLGNNTGDINLGNNGQVTPTSAADTEEEGYLGIYSSDLNSGERYYGDGYNNNKDIGFECIINNNNNNTVVEAPPPPIEDECPEADEIESCFRQFLLDFLFPNFVDELESGITVEINGKEVTLRSFEDICEALEGLTTFVQLQSALVDILAAAGITDIFITPLAACIAEVLGIPVPHG